MKTKTITRTSIMAAFLCILGPLAIPLPFSPVPVSLTNLGLYLTVYALGTRHAAISYFIYLLIGFVGLPVFSGFTSGPAKLLGPTGGYLIGFLFLCLISGFFIDRWYCHTVCCFLGMILGTCACYLFGTCWLSYQSSLDFLSALSVGVVAFIPADLCKIIIAMIVGPHIRKMLKRAGLN